MNQITINGKVFEVAGNNVNIVGGKVLVNGVEVKWSEQDTTILTVKWEGLAADITTDAYVNCGDVGGNVNAGAIG